MDKHIKDNVYWTYEIKEDRAKSEIESEMFIINTYISSVDSITYFFVDPIKYNLSQIKKIISKINNLKDIVIYNHENKMIYLYGEDFIFGIDLILLDLYFDIKKVNVIKRLDKLGFIYGSELKEKHKDYLERINNKIKYLPYIEFKERW